MTASTKPVKAQWLMTVVLAACSVLQTGGAQPADKILVPGKGWPCGMPQGIPVPETGIRVFEVTMSLDQSHDLGRTPFGHRKVFVTKDGVVSGEKLKGIVMPGGFDFELGFSNGAMEVEQVLVLKTSDGRYIYWRNAGTAANSNDVRFVADFEAPAAGNYAWLNTGKFVGRRFVDTSAKTLRLTVFDVSALVTETNAANLVYVSKPADVPDQPWNSRIKSPGEKRGETLITETVTLGPGQSVGATKNGGRNIIPITGGTLSGKLTGRILAGGADYQKLANPMTLDARYLWQTDDGEVIIVRNAGTMASLVPVFEVRVDSKYGWLNEGRYSSSGPEMGAGGVKLTFYLSAE